MNAKKIISLLLLSVFIMGNFSNVILAGSTLVEIEGSRWYVEHSAYSDTASLVYFEPITSLTTLVIPTTIVVDDEYLTVNSARGDIHDFNNITRIKSYLPIRTNMKVAGSTSIKEAYYSLPDASSFSFKGCTSLKKVELFVPKSSEALEFENFTDLDYSYRTIGISSFEDCTSLEEVYLPSELMKINAQAFKNCTSLKKINFRDGLVSIAGGAFNNCDLSSIVIPASVTSFASAFNYNDNLNDIAVLSDGNDLAVNNYLLGKKHPGQDPFHLSNRTNEGRKIYAYPGGKLEMLANVYGYNFIPITGAGDLPYGIFGKSMYLAESTNNDGKNIEEKQVKVDHNGQINLPAFDKLQKGLKDLSSGIGEKILDILVSSFNSEDDLDDSISSWAEQEVSEAILLGVVPEELQDDYTKDITRGEFAKLIYQTIQTLTGFSDDEMDDFADFPSIDNEFYSEYTDSAVSFVYGCGIVKGYGDGSFKPNNSITRQEAAVMLCNMADVLGYETSSQAGVYFSDTKNEWGKKYIDKVSALISPYSNERVMGGTKTNTFSPQFKYSREQAIMTIWRITGSIVGQETEYNYEESIMKPEVPVEVVPSEETPVEIQVEDTYDYSFADGRWKSPDGYGEFTISHDDSPDFFYYHFNYKSPYHDLTYVVDGVADLTSDSKASDLSAGIKFVLLGDTSILITTDFLDELYTDYGMPDGTYKYVGK
ncbi:MAG: hypothetical protein CVU84_16920 [Firmicutes bacterium HGW-Firmicutes-1]|jgi:hypothetical protein|nr:MAG: hypothetical protein CVU84_16920 [Firmicutes bacterium HGW-Firmicutes-1]